MSTKYSYVANYVDSVALQKQVVQLNGSLWGQIELVMQFLWGQCCFAKLRTGSAVVQFLWGQCCFAKASSAVSAELSEDNVALQN